MLDRNDLPYRLLIGTVIVGLLMVAMHKAARAQHNHERHHSDYQSWASGKTGNCCNNHDCGSLAETDVRETAVGPQVKISGQWCPVLSQHYLTKGKSPDWNTPHACIQKSTAYNNHIPPCDRLLCFAGKGGM